MHAGTRRISGGGKPPLPPAPSRPVRSTRGRPSLPDDEEEASQAGSDNADEEPGVEDAAVGGSSADGSAGEVEIGASGTPRGPRSARVARSRPLQHLFLEEGAADDGEEEGTPGPSPRTGPARRRGGGSGAVGRALQEAEPSPPPLGLSGEDGARPPPPQHT